MPILTLFSMLSPAKLWKRIMAKKYHIWYETCHKGHYHIFYTNSWGLFTGIVRKFNHISYEHRYWSDVWYTTKEDAEWFLNTARTMEALRAYKAYENKKAIQADRKYREN